MNKTEEKVKQKLIDARRAIRKKVLAIKLNKAQEDEHLEKTYKPLIEPLKKLYKSENVAMKQIKTETDEDIAADNDESIIKKKRKDISFLAKSTPKKPRFISDEDVFQTSVGEENENSEDEEEENAEKETSNQSLYEIIAENATPTEIEQYLNNFDVLPRHYFKQMLKDKTGMCDHRYGINYDPESGNWKIGNKIVTIEGKDILVGNKSYAGTPGLYDLLFLKSYKPNYFKEDLDNYRDILKVTNAANRYYEPGQQRCGSRMKKYKLIVKPLLENKYDHLIRVSTRTPVLVRRRRSSLPDIQTGRGCDKLLVENKPYQYVYWNDINELIDRLCLLHASAAAGNTSHRNEIIAIEEELREANVIV